MSVPQVLTPPASGVDPGREVDRTFVFLKVGILVALVFAIYWSSLWRLWSKTNPFYGEGNWGHAFIVPLIGLYYLYLNRDDLARARILPVLPSQFDRLRLAGASAFIVGGLVVWFGLAPFFTGTAQTLLAALAKGGLLFGGLVLLLNWGVGSLVFGLLTFGYGIWPGQNDYVKDLGLIITIFGIVLTLCGWQVMRTAWFPIAFLVCALPWPGLVYSWVAGPLQQLAATVAVFVLQITGVDATQSGTKIVMSFGPLKPERVLNVAEACAGLRSLMTFITVGAAVAFLSQRPLWQKVFITLMAIPIAILCNVMRVSGQGIIDSMGYHDFAEGFAHQFVGLVMLIPAFFMLLGVAWLVDNLFVEEVDRQSVTEAAARSATAPAATTIRRSIRPAATAPASTGNPVAPNGRADVHAASPVGANGAATDATGPRRPHLG
jgi:exosortase